MKTFLKAFFLILSILIIWGTYIFITFPNKEKIQNKFKHKYSINITPDKNNYDSLIKIDIEEKRTILLGEAKSAEMHNNSFPFSTHKFELNETERILKIINDSTNFDWGEIGTPYYDKFIIFFDKNKNKIGYVNISLDGQIDVFPNLTHTKWGLLSDKGFRELVIAIRTE
ncbi:MAG: hypothetical protein V4572_10665 [Bacteroidota bacterium]